MRRKPPKEQAEAESEVRDLFLAGKLTQTCRLAQAALDAFPKSVEIWKIFGAALGSLGRPKEARRAFLAALELAPNDPTSIANYVTSCFHDGDAKNAIAAIELYFDELPNETQSVVLGSLAESIQAGIVNEADLPPVILSLFDSENEVLGDLEIDPLAGESQGVYKLSKQDNKEISNSLESIQGACTRLNDSIKKGELSVKDADDVYSFIEEKLVEIAIILDGAID